MRSDMFGSLIGADVSLDSIAGELDSRGGLNAARFHFPTGDRISFDPVAGRGRGMLRVAAEVDSCFEHFRLAKRRAAELRAILVATRSVDAQQPIAEDAMPCSDQVDAAELHAVQLVGFDQDV